MRWRYRHLWMTASIVLTAAALGILGMRLSGPGVRPLSTGFPYLVRQPPSLTASFPPFHPGVNPGEEISRLHERGIKGKNIGIAIIDRPLLIQHQEFADRLRWYDEIDTEPDEPAGWHSTAVASIAAGKTLGVAPEADLYFIGVGMIWDKEPLGNWLTAFRRAVHFGQTLPLAIRRILELNRRLPAHRKIRVLSLSVGGGSSFLQAIHEARRDGLFVSAFDLGLPRLGPTSFASPTAPDAYTTHETPAGSWAIAHLAGRYALACQEDPQMTPERFLQQNKLQIH
jgi:hypothetical protein